jgi:FkbM family methyltransferase
VRRADEVSVLGSELHRARRSQGTWIQQIGVAGYALLTRAGLMKLPLLRHAFHAAYEFYKLRIEAESVDGLRGFVPDGSLVVDVGANIGFFTLRFAEWVGADGRVIAIEPDIENFDVLGRRLARSGLAARVDCHQAVAAAGPGPLKLRRNEGHPGDHRISTDGEGLEVRAETIDRVVAPHAGLPIALVKIDVQGAEMLVLEGSRRTLDKGPALFIEIDRGGLREFGASPEAIVKFLEPFGYRMHELARDGSTHLLDEGQLGAMLDRGGYVDVLFLVPGKRPAG